MVTNEEFDYIKDKVNKIERLIGNMTDVSSRYNRNALHKAYDIAFNLHKYIEKIEKS